MSERVCAECQGDGTTTYFEPLQSSSGCTVERHRIVHETCRVCDGLGWIALSPMEEDEE